MIGIVKQLEPNLFHPEGKLVVEIKPGLLNADRNGTKIPHIVYCEIAQDYSNPPAKANDVVTGIVFGIPKRNIEFDILKVVDHKESGRY